MKASKKSAQPNLSEYEEEAVPFDEVIKRLGNAKHAPAPKVKAAKKAPKRKPRG